MNQKRFGRSSEKLEADNNQMAFIEVDGKIVFFNEAKAVAAITEYDEDEPIKPRPKKTKGKRASLIQDLPVVPVSHMMSEEELIAEFGEDGWYQLEDEVYNRYKSTPAKVEIEEHHVGVYKSKKNNHFNKAKHPGYLLRNSLVSPSLLAAILNAKYVNAVHYFIWNIKGETELKHDEKLYQVSPWALVYDDENYYFEAFDAIEKRMKTYRVDKMKDICVIEKKRQGATVFRNKDKTVYAKKLFGMYDGKEELVTLRCENYMANVIIDHFGRNVHMRPVDDENFEVKVEVAVSGNFLGWISGIGGVKIVGPKSVVEEMKQIKERLMEEY